MYLTRIELDMHKKMTQIAMRNPNIFHGAIENTFKDNTERKLWRIDTLRGRRYLMIVSRTLPDFSSMLWQFAPAGAESQSKPYDDFLNGIKEGQKWAFRLCATPTASKKTDEDRTKRGKPCTIVEKEEQLKWLLKRAERNGFHTDEKQVSIIDPGPIDFKKGTGDNQFRFRMRKVTFNGTLTVTDAELFKAALVNGIGREKAFGGGLLTVAPI